MTRSIVELLSSKDIEIKKKAIFALGELKNRKAVRALVQVVIQETHSEVKVLALEALIKIGSAQGLEAMILSVEDLHPLVRATAVKGIGVLGNSKQIPLIASKLRDKDKMVRAEAVDALHRIGGKKVDHLLNPLLEDPDSCVRVNTVIALHQVGSQEAIETLKNMVQDNKGAMRAGAAYAIGKIAPNDMIDTLEDLLNDRDPRVRQNAIEALRDIESERKLELLGKALGDENPEIQEAATETLQKYQIAPLEQIFSLFKKLNKIGQRNLIEIVGKWKNPKALPFFAQILKQEQEDFLRFSIIEAISDIKNDEAVNLLITILREKGEPLRMNAADALRKIASPRTVEMLLDLLRDRSVDGFGRILAAETLELIGEAHISKASRNGWKGDAFSLENQSQQTVPLLKKTLKAELETLLRNLITEETLRSLKEPEMTEPLIQFLQEENDDIKQKVFKTIKNLGDGEPVVGIVKKLSSIDMRGRAALLEAMERIDRELTKLILPFLNQPDPYVIKANMARLLKQHGRQIEIKNLESLLHSPSETINRSAMLTLFRLGYWNVRTGKWIPA
jgi:HEAT repeat protein